MARMLDGTTWLPISEAAKRGRVRVETVRQWVNRGRVQKHKLGGRTWVCYDDVADCELEWRKRAGQAVSSRPKSTLPGSSAMDLR